MPIYTAVFAALALAAPAAATDTSTEVPNTPRTNVYFLCDGETKEGTVNALATNHYSSWSEERPAGSITSGEGCGQLEDGSLGGIRPSTPYEFTAVGYYTGNLDTLSFKMHNIFVGQRRQEGNSTVDVTVLIDGESLFGRTSTTNAAGDVSTEPRPRRFSIKPAGSGPTGAAAVYEATITGIDHMLPADNIEHEIVFNITSTETMNGWVWGNAEAPSGLTFNPDTWPANTTQAMPRADRSR